MFEEKTQLKQLTAITGPAISNEIMKQLAYHFAYGTPIVILDAPTLFEVRSTALFYCAGIKYASKTQKLVPLCAKIIVIAVDEDKQIQRVMQRDSVTEEEVRNRMKHQMTTREKVKRGDITL